MDLLDYVNTCGENYAKLQQMGMEKLKEFIMSEECFSKFMYCLVPFDQTYGNKLLSHINNKKYKVTLVSDVKNMET